MAKQTISQRAVAGIRRPVAAPLIPASFPLGKAWFVVCCYGQQERDAAREITDLGFTAYLPMEVRIVVSRGRKVKVDRPLLRGYVFVQFDREADDWGALERIDGALGILQNNQIPMRVPDLVIDRIRAAEAAGVFDYSNPSAAFSPGDDVEILEGPFAGIIAKVKANSPRKRARLFLNSLGEMDIDAAFLRKVD